MSKIKHVGEMQKDIMNRCYEQNDIMYDNYGGKGIKVCDEWHDIEAFKKWAYSNGYKPNAQLKRRDTKKDYCPENCYFAYKNDEKKKTRTIIKNYGIKMKDNPLYPTYSSMKKRCMDPDSEKYKTYGGKGINLCEEWSGEDGVYNFTIWAINNGWSEELTLDRIDNNRGYSPANCRWVTTEEQQHNTKRDYTVFHDGKEKKIRELAKETGIDSRILYKGIVSCGLPPETVISIALTTLEYTKTNTTCPYECDDVCIGKQLKNDGWASSENETAV